VIEPTTSPQGPSTEDIAMKRLDHFEVLLDSGIRARLTGRRKRVIVETLVDSENTYVVLDCSSCPELLGGKLPRGALISLVTVLREFFEAMGMRMADVAVNDAQMTRVYAGVLNREQATTLRNTILHARLDSRGKK